MDKLKNIILETLRSYNKDVVEKMISNFFNKRGYYEKYNFGNDDDENPNFMIITDERMIKKYEPDYDYNLKYHDIGVFYNFNNPNLLKDLLNLINTSGYYISAIGKSVNVTDKNKIYDTLKNLKKITLFIEPIYGEDVKNKNVYLYHTTPKKYIDKIKEIGLVPKTKNKRSFYPERIYLSPNLKWNNSIKKQLESDIGEEFVTLKIIKPKNLKLYRDIRFKGGYFTYDVIPPKNIIIK